MAVYQVVVAGLALRLRPEHPTRHRAELAGQILLGQTLERTRDDVAHQDAGRQLDHRGQVPARGAGEDLDLGAERGQSPGQLDDVDVHASGVARARLVER